MFFTRRNCECNSYERRHDECEPLNYCIIKICMPRPKPRFEPCNSYPQSHHTCCKKMVCVCCDQ